MIRFNVYLGFAVYDCIATFSRVALSMLYLEVAAPEAEIAGLPFGIEG
jgi:hypothetical protein